MRRSLKLFLIATLLGVAAAFPATARAAETPAGQTIVNQAQATYNDPNGNSYTTNSNTVTTYVQNAPTLTVTTNNGSSPGSAAQPNAVPVVPGATVSDTYTLTNTGNNSGDFQVPGSPTSGVTGAGTDNGQTANVLYTATNLPNPSAGACSGQPFTTIASLNGCLAVQSVASAGSINVTVTYTINQNATTPGSVTTALNATLTYAQVNGNTPAATSATVGNTYNDPVSPDARLDLQKSSSQNPVSGNLTYTIVANNGGGATTHYLALNTDLPSLPSAGILISDKIPTFGGTPLALQSVPTIAVATGALTAGATAQLVYTTAAGGTSGWTVYSSGPLPANTTYVGVYISGGTSPVGGACTVAGDSCGLVSAPSGSSNAGGVGTVTTPQITLTFVTAPPTGPGSGNPNAVTNLANSVAGSNGSNGPCVIGPGTSAPTGCTTDNPANVDVPVGNTTPSLAPSGASNQVGNSGLSTTSVLNGPVGAPGATGSYNGSAAVNNNDDFTAVGFCNTVTSINSSTTVGSPTGNSISTSGCATIIVGNAVQNTGNVSDTYTFTATTPGGWSVTFCLDAACATPMPSNKLTVASDVTTTYYVKYTPPASVTTLLQYDFAITATGTGGGSDNNATHNDLYAGFVALTKSATVTSNGCPSGVTPPANQACPGGVIAYDVNYLNIAQSGGTGNTEPATALLTAKSFVITENGTVAPNNWGTYTNGLNAPATDATPGAVITGGGVGSKSFTDSIATLAPAATGDLKFAVTVN